MGAARGAAIGVMLAVAVSSTTVFGDNQRTIVMEEFNVPATDPGIALYVRNKHPADISRVTPEQTVLFVHGATFPAEAAFDLAPDGPSWMDFVAGHGFDAYLVDVRATGARRVRRRWMYLRIETHRSLIQKQQSATLAQQ